LAERRNRKIFSRIKSSNSDISTKKLLADYYANADVFVHPNPREPFGIAPLEAMASGVPDARAERGRNFVLRDNENIWLVEPTAKILPLPFAKINRKSRFARKQNRTSALKTARANTREKSTDFLLATYDRMYEDFQKRKEFFTDIEKAKISISQVSKW
jgi:glycosyltransferase involved in cell wall biosynthesis